MKQWQTGSLFLLVFALAVTGCAKKSTEQASITGFDTTSEELAQLPPQTGNTSGAQAIEVLPVETSPITQAVAPMVDPTAAGADGAGLSREQQIQTALKNAGFYHGNIDGKIGPASKRAVEEFQKQHNLKVDGKVGPQTWGALEPYLNGSGQQTAMPENV